MILAQGMLMQCSHCITTTPVQRHSSTFSLQLPPHVHEPYTRAEDAYLWANQNGDLDQIAADLGRGPTSCALRLKRLRNPKSSGYKRLFGADEDDQSATACVGDGDGGCIAGEAKKQPSLRPMRECIQRIMYGGDLSSRDFVIGYRDRFRAVPCEAPFDAPNESISGGERSLVQALPEHRIEYLKYRKRLVWHKEQRLDNMFGGQGGLTIRQVVDTYEAWERNRRRRVQRARDRAIDALGGGVEGQAALDAFKKQLGRVVRGKADADAFVSDVLSPGYFGEDGYGVSDRPEALSEEESALITDDTEEDEDSKLMPPVVELLRTLPDERAALREDLLRMLSARGVRVRMDME